MDRRNFFKKAFKSALFTGAGGAYLVNEILNSEKKSDKSFAFIGSFSGYYPEINVFDFNANLLKDGLFIDVDRKNLPEVIFIGDIGDKNFQENSEENTRKIINISGRNKIIVLDSDIVENFSIIARDITFYRADSSVDTKQNELLNNTKDFQINSKSANIDIIIEDTLNPILYSFEINNGIIQFPKKIDIDLKNSDYSYQSPFEDKIEIKTYEKKGIYSGCGDGMQSVIGPKTIPQYANIAQQLKAKVFGYKLSHEDIATPSSHVKQDNIFQQDSIKAKITK